MSPPVLPIIGDPDAGPLEHRYRAAIESSLSWLLIAIGAATAAPLATFVPQALIVSIAGLALIRVLLAALEDVVSGPLTLGPVIAFVVVLSDISVLGLGPFFSGRWYWKLEYRSCWDARAGHSFARRPTSQLRGRSKSPKEPVPYDTWCNSP